MPMPMKIRFGWTVFCAALVAPAAAVAAPADAADVTRLQGEVQQLKQELADQRQLILQLMQAEQQRYDVVIRFLRNGGGSGGGDVSSLPPIGEAYVYIDGLRSSAKGHTVEIKQRDKQFSPRVTVVPLGTKVVFPNQDTVIHNVFSTAPGNAFDLGSVKGGETSPPVVLLKPGPVEIFCNIHSKMRADILVVPNNHWARVAADGSFSLAGVPIGNRRIVLWSPTLKPVSQQVDVGPKGGTVSFNSESSAIRPHLNKRGQAYGSYDE
jgi:plastocyanin